MRSSASRARDLIVRFQAERLQPQSLVDDLQMSEHDRGQLRGVHGALKDATHLDPEVRFNVCSTARRHTRGIGFDKTFHNKSRAVAQLRGASGPGSAPSAGLGADRWAGCS